MLKPYIFYSLKLIVLMLTFTFALYGTFYSYIEFGIGNIHFFTNQSNLLVAIVTFLMVFGFDQVKVFKPLASIALLDIILTGVIYNLLLTEYARNFTDSQQFLMLVTHTIVPLLFTMLYLGFIQIQPKYSDIKLLWIHPLLYFIGAQIIGMFTHYYPYPFINPKDGVLRMLVINFLIVFPLLTLVGLGLIAFKRGLNQKIKQSF